MDRTDYNDSSSKEEELPVGEAHYWGKWIGNKFFAVKRRFTFGQFRELDEPKAVSNKTTKLATGRKLKRNK